VIGAVVIALCRDDSSSARGSDGGPEAAAASSPCAQRTVTFVATTLPPLATRSV
jgi:hypothetical protein